MFHTSLLGNIKDFSNLTLYGGDKFHVFLKLREKKCLKKRNEIILHCVFTVFLNILKVCVTNLSIPFSNFDCLLYILTSIMRNLSN